METQFSVMEHWIRKKTIGEPSNVSPAKQTKRRFFPHKCKYLKDYRERNASNLSTKKGRHQGHPSSNCLRGRQWVLSGSSRNMNKQLAICATETGTISNTLQQISQIMAAEL
jgi:hypothetical protein